MRTSVSYKVRVTVRGKVAVKGKVTGRACVSGMPNRVEGSGRELLERWGYGHGVVYGYG